MIKILFNFFIIISIIAIMESGFIDRNFFKRRSYNTDFDILDLYEKSVPSVSYKNVVQKKRIIQMEATFYSREETNNFMPASGVRGSTLSEAKRGYGLLQVATDPKVIPMFTRFNIKLWDNGDSVPAVALDVGGAIVNKIIDIYVDTIEEAINLGRKNVLVEFV